MNYKIPFLLAFLGTAVSHAQDADLAIQLSNPVADLYSVPIQSNFDFGIGAGDGTRWTTNIQPVIPFGRTDDLTLLSQTILPIINVEGVAPCGVGDASGMGDILKSFFFASNGADPIWGIGPVFLIPTVTDSLLGGEKWWIGPTAVITKQEDLLTYGALAPKAAPLGIQNSASSGSHLSGKVCSASDLTHFTTPRSPETAAAARLSAATRGAPTASAQPSPISFQWIKAHLFSKHAGCRRSKRNVAWRATTSG